MYPLKIGLLVSEANLWQQVQSALRDLPVTVVFEAATIEGMAPLIDKIAKFTPEVLLVHPEILPEPLPDFLRSLRAVGVHTEVVVIEREANTDDILTALRAGAKEYLYPPFVPSLKESLERISREIEAAVDRKAPARGNVIGVLSVKGGCGATTLACHMALEIAHRRKTETLLADLDFSAGLIRILMHATSRYSMLDAVSNLQRLDPSYWRGLVSNGYEGLEVIAATPVEAPHRMPQSTELQRVMRFVRSQYSWTVADLGRGLDPFTLASVSDFETILLVTSMEMPALQLAKLTLRYILESGVSKDRVKLVINRFSKRHGLTREDVEAVLGAEAFGVIPNDYRSLEDAYSREKLLPENSQVRQAIAVLAEKLTGEGEQKPKKKFSLFGL